MTYFAATVPAILFAGVLLLALVDGLTARAPTPPGLEDWRRRS